MQLTAEQNVRNAIANGHLEGIEYDDAAKMIARRLAEGELTVDQARSLLAERRANVTV